MTINQAQRRTDILAQIERLQSIQKTHPSGSSAWMQASELLAELFAEMARIDRPVMICAS